MQSARRFPSTNLRKSCNERSERRTIEDDSEDALDAKIVFHGVSVRFGVWQRQRWLWRGRRWGHHVHRLAAQLGAAGVGQLLAQLRQQILDQTGRLPDVVVACVGGGSNAIGIFDAFIADEAVRLATDARRGAEGVERAAAAARWDEVKTHAAALGNACQACHQAHRERFDDGSFRIKKPGTL